MSYSATQLTAYYIAVTGIAPDTATGLLITAYAQQDAAGTLTDAQTLSNVLHLPLVLASTDVAVTTYAFFTGTVPSAAGLAFLTSNTTANTTALDSSYYTQFNNENRYYNFAINLAFGSASAAAFSTTYSALTLAQVISTAYETIVGTVNVGAAASAAAQASITASIPYFQAVAASRAAGLNQDLATKAIIIGYIMEEGVKADVGTYAKALDQFNADVAGGVAIYGPGTSLAAVYSPGGAGYNIGIGGSGSVVGGTPGSTFNFTGGIDNLVGTANDDTFNGAIITNGTATLFTTFSAADSAVGNGGNDTLNIAITDALGGATGAIAVPAAAISGIRNILVRGTSSTAADVDTVTAGNFSGAVQFISDRSTNAVTFTGLATGQAIGINGNAATTIGAVTASYGATVAAETINLTNGTTPTGGVAPTLTITTGASAMATATINSSGAANTIGALQLNVAGSVSTLNIAANTALTTGAITGLGSSATGVTTETINISGVAAVTLGALGTAGSVGVTTLNVNVNNASTLTTGVISGLWAGVTTNTINVSGTATTATANTAAVTLGVIDASVKTINGSGLTAGGISATIGANAGTIFTGGTGTDVVTVGAGQGAALTGAVNGGGGANIIAFSTGADLASNLTPLVTNFQTLRVSNSGAAASVQTYNPTLISGITSYQVAASTGEVILNNLAAAATVTAVGNVSGGVVGPPQQPALVLNLKDASGANDVVNLVLSQTSNNLANQTGLVVGSTAFETFGGGIAFGGSAVAGQVETLNIVSSARVAGTGAMNYVQLANEPGGTPFITPNKIVITGTNPINLIGGTLTHTVAVDASGLAAAFAYGNGGGGGFLQTIVGSPQDDYFGLVGPATVYGGAGGDGFFLDGSVGQTIVYKASSDSQLDLTANLNFVGAGATTRNVGNTGASLQGTVNTSPMDVVIGFVSGASKFDISTFGFGASALGGGIGGNGTAGGITVASDPAFMTAITSPNLFSDGILTRGLAQIHGTAGMSSGVAGDFLIIDVNKNGVYDAGTDLVIKLTGGAFATGGGLVIGDFAV